MKIQMNNPNAWSYRPLVTRLDCTRIKLPTKTIHLGEGCINLKCKTKLVQKLYDLEVKKTGVKQNIYGLEVKKTDVKVAMGQLQVILQSESSCPDDDSKKLMGMLKIKIQLQLKPQEWDH